MSAKIIKTKYSIELHSEDENGTFVLNFITTLDGATQIQMKSQGGDDEAYINVDKSELYMIKEIVEEKLLKMAYDGK